jgi:hypothetical protein
MLVKAQFYRLSAQREGENGSVIGPRRDACSNGASFAPREK